MDKSVLLVTPQTSLEDVVRKALNEVGTYDLRTTNDFYNVVNGNKPQFTVALLDAELEEQGVSILDVGRELRQFNDKVQIIVITNPRSWLTDEINELAPRGYISKPLNAAELAKMMNDGKPTTPKVEPALQKRPVPVETSAEIPWLQDINRAAQHLTRLTLESSAQAALITLDNELWAYAGQLSKAAAQEITQTIQKYWDHEEKSDLLRFIRLEATRAEHMLYATRLSPQMILALVFDAETPFSTIRTQAGKLAGSLATTPPVETPREERKRETEEYADLPQLSEVLSDVPPPNPTKLESSWETIAIEEGNPAPAAPTFSMETNPPVQRGSEARYEIQNPDLYFDEAALAVTRKHVPTTDEMAQFAVTRRHTVEEQRELEEAEQRAAAPEGARKIVLEPVSPALYNLSYACLLIPRFDRHYLTGDLADRVTGWMQDVCIAYGWRLEHIAVRPEYLQWIANVPPSVSPGFIMRIVRQQISSRIFTDFPKFARENPSGDFWAPGYLIMGGPQPHPPKLIKDFIAQTRQRQGITRPPR